MTLCPRFLRVLPAVLLIAGAAVSLAPVSPVLAATISDCPTTESALQTDITNAGNGGTVQFACSGPTTIYFSSTITINLSVTLDAGTSTGSVTFDGSNGGNPVQLFVVNSGKSLTLNSLTLQNASPTCSSDGCIVDGGAIDNNGTLTITDSTLSGNSPACTGSPCTVFGGAIDNLGTLTITDSTLSGNSPTCSTSVSGFGCGVNGGAIDSDGTLTITDSTLSGNSPTCTGSFCDVSGGAIDNVGTLTIINSTLSGNSTTCTGSNCFVFGGAIDNAAPRTTIGGTIVAGNTANGSLYNCIGTAPDDEGYNLTDDTTCGFSTANHDIIETSTSAVGLDPNGLQNNGGPTQTIALLPTSPAIDQIPLGYSFTANTTTYDLCPANGTDQRGYPRPDANEAFCDIGAYEYQDSEYRTPTGQDAYDIESSNFSCPAGGTSCVTGTSAASCLTTAPCPGITYGDVEAFGPPNNAANGIPDEMVLACVQGTGTGYQIGYLDVLSHQGNLDYPGGVYGNADSGVISGKGTLIGGGGAEDNPSQPSSVTASVYDASTGIIGSVSGIQNTDNGSNTLNSGQFRVTIRGRLWTVNLMGTSPVFTQNATSSTMSCTVGGSHANDLKNAGLDTVSLAEGELEPSLGDNFFLQSVARHS